MTGRANLGENSMARGQWLAFGPLGFNHGQNPRHLIPVDVKNAVWVGGGSAPFCTAIESRENNCALATRRCKRRVWAKFRKAFQRLPMCLGRNVGNFIIS